jgi:hypothetical protein
VPLYFFCLVGIKIDRQIQVDKHTWIYINTQRFTRERERERERERDFLYIYKAIKLKHMLDYFKEKRNGNMLYYDVIEKQRYDW